MEVAGTFVGISKAAAFYGVSMHEMRRRVDKGATVSHRTKGGHRRVRVPRPSLDDDTTRRVIGFLSDREHIGLTQVSRRLKRVVRAAHTDEWQLFVLRTKGLVADCCVACGTWTNYKNKCVGERTHYPGCKKYACERHFNHFHNGICEPCYQYCQGANEAMCSFAYRTCDDY